MSSSRGASGTPSGAPGRPSQARPGAKHSVHRVPDTSRPSSRSRLSDVKLEDDEVVIDAFDAMLGEVKVRVTAVLERTCVYIDRDGDRRLVSKKDLWVEVDRLPIRRRGAG